MSEIPDIEARSKMRRNLEQSMAEEHPGGTSWQFVQQCDDIPTLLAALATAEERAEKLASQLAVEQALCADNERQRDEAEQLANEYLAMLCADAKPVEEVVASLRRAAAEHDNG